jgi:glycosyltransferase involved in cell wall biosynthesis
VLPLGFDFSRFDATPEERRDRREAFRREFGISVDAGLVTIVARLEPIKRVDRFLRLANEVETSPATWFLVFGDGALREELQSSPERRACASGSSGPAYGMTCPTSTSAPTSS